MLVTPSTKLTDSAHAHPIPTASVVICNARAPRWLARPTVTNTPGSTAPTRRSKTAPVTGACTVTLSRRLPLLSTTHLLAVTTAHPASGAQVTSPPPQSAQWAGIVVALQPPLRGANECSAPRPGSHNHGRSRCVPCGRGARAQEIWKDQCPQAPPQPRSQGRPRSTSQ